MRQHVAYSVVLCLLASWPSCEAFAPIAPRRALTIGLHSSLETTIEEEPNPEWGPRNAYDDLDVLRRVIAQKEASTNLEQNNNRRLMDSFAMNRRAIWPDIRNFVLLPTVAAMLLTTLSTRIRNTLRIASVMEFWTVLVCAPIALGYQKYTSLKALPELSERAEALSEDAKAMYRRILEKQGKDEDASPRSDDYVLCLLEQWLSSIVGVVAFGYYARRQQSQYAKLLPIIRFVTRLGVYASLHQYPKQLYDLRQQPRPLRRSDMRSRQLLKLTFKFALIGLTLDFSEILATRIPRVESIFAVFFSSLIALSDLPQALPIFGSVKEVMLQVLQLIPTFFLGRFLYKSLATTSAMLPVALIAPVLHIKGLLRLLRLSYTHDISLASSDLQTYPDEALKERTRWRFRLEWREPKRLRHALPRWLDAFVFRYYFSGSVNQQLDNFHGEEHNKLFRAKMLENFRKDPCLPTSKEANMKRLAKEHQEDYESKEFKDALGVAVQQTFGIGLGYPDGHMDPLQEGEKLTAGRLQARAAKSAIRRVNAIFQEALDEDLDAITVHADREKRKAEIREREEAERTYLARQLTELVPLFDDDESDEEIRSNETLKMRRSDVKAMYNVFKLDGGLMQYDELPGDSVIDA